MHQSRQRRDERNAAENREAADGDRADAEERDPVLQEEEIKRRIRVAPEFVENAVGRGRGEETVGFVLGDFEAPEIDAAQTDGQQKQRNDGEEIGVSSQPVAHAAAPHRFADRH